MKRIESRYNIEYSLTNKIFDKNKSTLKGKQLRE